jgi:hypothetical protein
MMMRPHIYLSALFLLAGTAAAPAQPPSAVPPPKPPVLSRAPEFAAWTVTYKYRPSEVPADTPAPEPERLQTLAVQKTRKTYCEKQRLTSGKTSEKWVFDSNIQLMMPLGDTSIVALNPPSGEDYPSPDYSDYSACDFPGLEWVSLENYRGVETFQGAQVYKFEADGKTVLLAVATQLPVAASDKLVTRLYAFGPPPTVELVPSKRFQIALATHKKGLQLLRKNPSTP